MNKILLVDDDDRELTSLLKELLEMEGFNVIVTHDGNRRLIFWVTALIPFCLT